MEKIIAVFQNRSNAVRVRDAVEGGGLAAVTVCVSGAQARRVLAVEPVGLVVSGFQLADGSAEELFADLPAGCPMLLIASQARLDLCGQEEIFRLAAPVSRRDLVASVRMLLQLSRRGRPTPKPPRSQEEQAVIRRAKEVLMDRHGMTEEQAHRFLQKKSMDAGAKLVQTAQLIADSW